MATSTVNRIIMSAKRKYILDNVDGCVFGKSLYLLTNKYKGYCLEVQRLSDSATLNVGFNFALKNPYVDVSAIESFCAGTTGRVKTWYDQFLYPNATQSTFNNMPIIATNGVFETNGIKFVAIENTYLVCLNYAAIQITVQPISFYTNYNNISSHTSYIFAKNSDTSNRSISLVGIAGNITAYINNSTVINSVAIQNAIGINKVLFKWETGTNNSKINANGSEVTATYNTTPITNTDTNVCIGARFNTYPAVSTYLNGYLNTVLIFNTNQYDNYSLISGGC